MFHRSFLIVLLISLPLAPCRAMAASQWEIVGQRYHLSPLLLYAIAKVESGLNPQALHSDADGTYDIGLMQISSTWLPILQRFGISAQDLYNSYTNLQVGAWILAQNVRQYGATWKAVGAYNARSVPKQIRYVKRVAKQLDALLASPHPDIPVDAHGSNRLLCDQSMGQRSCR